MPSFARLRRFSSSLMHSRHFPFARFCALLFVAVSTHAEEPTFGDWVEPDFPFFSSIVDARVSGHDLLATNLTPRGIVVRVGTDCWACFDVDLLRVSAIWQGGPGGVTPMALAPGSYHNPSKKTPGGQSPAPRPDGKVWMANGIYPGWQKSQGNIKDTTVSLSDPRPTAPTPEEVGRGPLDPAVGRFGSIRLSGDMAIIEYRIGTSAVSEWFTASGAGPQAIVQRHVVVGAGSEDLLLVVGEKNDRTAVALSPAVIEGAVRWLEHPKLWVLAIPARTAETQFSVCMGLAEVNPTPIVTEGRLLGIPQNAPRRRWGAEVQQAIIPSPSKAAYVVDDIVLPRDNPWRRNLRLSDIQFLKDGRGVAVTLDGDVWMISGLEKPNGPVSWKRFASGLHEPMSLAIRNEEIFVFDRNGIWILRDTNGDGEADQHTLFSNAFAQTADMREFPSTIRLAPGGEFVIAKGGQEATTLGRHNGSVLRIVADGSSATVLGYGFRQPNIGVNIRTGLVTASDQEGHYIPTTPLHIVQGGQFYGFLSTLVPKEKYPAPIAAPITWIPHSVTASAISQAWLFDSRMGPLSDSQVQIGFNKPQILRIMWNQRGSVPQAAVAAITQEFEFPPLNGSINPADGQLYVAGFQVIGWGTTAKRVAGMARVRYTGAPCTVPREVVPMDKGILLRFDVALDPKKATDPASYSIASWGYRRTFQYGSPQLKADGKPGQDWIAASSAYLSKDGRTVFLGVRDLKPVMQMRLGWSLATAEGVAFEENAYFTPKELSPFDPAAEGFEPFQVDLAPREVARKQEAPPTEDEGRRLYQMMGCAACHSLDGVQSNQVGPTWKGIFGQPRKFAKSDVELSVDESYLRESILEPAIKIVKGFERGEYGMPSYAGVLTDSQIDSLILFIKTVK